MSSSAKLEFLTDPATSARMQRIPQKGTAPEVRVREILTELGYRYRLHADGLPCRPDIVHKGLRRAIFVHGCYWHWHAGCALSSIPKSNGPAWADKFRDNRLRDARHVVALRERGYDVLVVWQCELAEEDALRARLRRFWESGDTTEAPKTTEEQLPSDQLALGAAKNGAPPSVETYRLDLKSGEIIRSVRRRASMPARRRPKAVESRVPLEEPVLHDDLAAAYDRQWLRSTELHPVGARKPPLTVMDLFAGAGGLTLGVLEAARALGMRGKPVFALDVDPDARHVYASNFPTARVSGRPIERLLPGNPGTSLSWRERRLRESLGGVDVLVGGPPCQGNSDLNNHTRRRDPKNELFFRMARAAEIVEPKHIIIENVTGVLHDEAEVFDRTVAFLRDELGYRVTHGLLHGDQLGVPQRRTRVFLVASKVRSIDLSQVEADHAVRPRTVDWAIRDLMFRPSIGVCDESSTPSKSTWDRIAYLFERDLYDLPDTERPQCHRDGSHSYRSVYGRMWPDRPAQTLTTGFMVMGQGRYVHPHVRRTLTPHEGARLQTFPDYFRFDGVRRTSAARLIGNAVPPKMAYAIAVELLR